MASQSSELSVPSAYDDSESEPPIPPSEIDAESQPPSFPSESEGENGEESESQPFEESESNAESTRAGESESESEMEPKEEEQYEQDDASAAGLSPRKVLKRACAELVPESALPVALSRQDTIAHFEAAVSAPDGPQYVTAPIEPGMDRTLSTSSTTATAALCGGAAAQLSRVDTFGQMEDASRAAAERGRGGGHGGARPPARRRPTAAAAPTRSAAARAFGTLRALPAVAAALSAVDDADGPAAVGAKPIARTDTMELLQSVDDDTAGAAGGGAEEAAAPRDAGPPGKIARVS